jgi:hypothetical protein
MKESDQFVPGIYSDRHLAYVLPNNVWENGGGSMNKGVLVVSCLRSDGEDDRIFLEKILSAAGMDLSNDVFWSAVDAEKGAYIGTQVDNKQWNRVLVFGLLPASLGINIEPIVYKPVQFNGCSWLFAENLPALARDPALKKKLWVALQALFQIVP